jgi:hypothetical protein
VRARARRARGRTLAPDPAAYRGPRRDHHLGQLVHVPDEGVRPVGQRRRLGVGERPTAEHGAIQLALDRRGQRVAPAVARRQLRGEPVVGPGAGARSRPRPAAQSASVRRARRRGRAGSPTARRTRSVRGWPRRGRDRSARHGAREDDPRDTATRGTRARRERRVLERRRWRRGAAAGWRTSAGSGRRMVCVAARGRVVSYRRRIVLTTLAAR